MSFNPFHIPTAFAQTAQKATQVSAETLGFLQAVYDFLWLQVPRWLAAIVIIVLAFFLAKIVKSIVENKLAEKGIEEEHQEVSILAGRAAHAAILIIGVTVGLKVGGIDLTTIIAAVAFGIGFALRDLIMNFLAGVLILLSRHFTIGDFIKVNDTLGRITEIQTRATILKGIDGTRIIVPNAELFSSQVTSFTSNPFRRIEMIIGVTYDTDLQLAIDTIFKAIKATPGILMEPKPAVNLTEFGDSSIDMKVKVWVESRSKWLQTKSNLIKSIKKQFDDADGVDMTFNILNVNLTNEKDAEKIAALPPEELAAPVAQPVKLAAPAMSMAMARQSAEPEAEPTASASTPAQAPATPVPAPTEATAKAPAEPEAEPTAKPETTPADQAPGAPATAASTAPIASVTAKSPAEPEAAPTATSPATPAPPPAVDEKSSTAESSPSESIAPAPLQPATVEVPVEEKPTNPSNPPQYT